MKKTLIVLTCALTIAGCDMPKDAKEARLRSAMMALPEGSKVVELFVATNGTLRKKGYKDVFE